MNEEWRDVPGFASYQVSNLGAIRNRKGLLISLQKSDKGYLKAWLYSSAKKRAMLVHRVVLLSFIGPSELQTNHIDGNKENNRLDNLEYVTCKENIHHGWRTGLMENTREKATELFRRIKKLGESNPASKLTAEQVNEIRSRHESGENCNRLGRAYGVHRMTIKRIVIGLRWSHAGPPKGGDV